MSSRLAIDIGGTFTDLVLLDERANLRVAKTPTTTQDPAIGVMTGIRKLGVDLPALSYFVHGTTIALNAILQRSGAKTGLITTKGFRDVLEIMRTNRPDMYNLQQDKPEPLVPRELRVEIAERLDYQGEELQPIDPDEVKRAARYLTAAGVEAIAVCLLFSYANPAHEERVRELIQQEGPKVPITISSELVREWREYERTSTTVINAHCRLVVARYLDDLQRQLREAGYRRELLIMQSNGGIMTAAEAKLKPVKTIMSGPVGGAIGGEHLSRLLGYPHLITLDIGGTSADVCLIDNGKAAIRQGREIDRLPVMSPTIDVNSIGAGGGSIAWIDRGGALQVGPRSAGAVPGPACYGTGGTEPTVTDANLVLGYLNPAYFLGGEIRLDERKAEQAIEEIIRRLNLGLPQTARGIIDIVNAKMVRAIRKVSVERGYDPRDFILVAFGGGGGMHGAQLAEDLNIPRVIIPLAPGALSALGMLEADVKHDLVRTYVRYPEEANPQDIEKVYEQLEREGRGWLTADGVEEGRISLVRSADLRYSGQEYPLTISMPATRVDLDEVTVKFHDYHQKSYGYAISEESIVFINLRVTAIGAMIPFEYQRVERRGESIQRAFKGRRRAFFAEMGGYIDCPTFERGLLLPDHHIEGPAIVEEPQSTTLIPPRHQTRVDEYGNLIIDVSLHPTVGPGPGAREGQREVQRG